jgi:hypothetical protein
MEALFLKLVNLSLTAGYLVLAVMLARLVFRRMPKWTACVLWGLVALRLICPVSPESTLSLIPSSEPIPREFIDTPTPQIQTGIAAVNHAVNPILSAAMTPAPGDSANPAQVLIFIISRVWVAGMMLMLLYAGISWLLLRRRVAAATLLQKNIKRSEQISAPFVLGLFRPVIYLPDFNPQRRYALRPCAMSRRTSGAGIIGGSLWGFCCLPSTGFIPCSGPHMRCCAAISKPPAMKKSSAACSGTMCVAIAPRFYTARFAGVQWPPVRLPLAKPASKTGFSP